MKMPNTKYTGSYIKGNLGGTKVSNPSLKKYYGKMIDAPGFKSGGKTAAWQRKEGKRNVRTKVKLSDTNKKIADIVDKK